MIERLITKQIKTKFNKQKAIVITGARQVGKTTLVKHLAEKSINKFAYWNCDEPDIRQMLDNPTSTKLKQMIGKDELVIIDEAQRIENIGINIKLIVDNIPAVQLLVTGSSSLELANKLNEPLTGRKFEYNLFPFSFKELVNDSSFQKQNRLLENRIIYGCYPEIVKNTGEEKDRLTELTTSYLFKDLLNLGNIRKPYILDKLIKALALQIGSESSYNELADTVGVNKDTISKYIDLLEKTYVVFTLTSFSRNQRRELKRSKKIYFWDTGIRNSVINNFNPLELRNDKGALWENYLISERMKYLNNNSIPANCYFWRTVQHQEIDYVEEREGNIFAFELKWNPKAKSRSVKTFNSYYPDSKFEIISTDNYFDFLS